MKLDGFFHILNPCQKARRAVRRLFKKVSPDLFSWVKKESHPTHLETIVEWSVKSGHSQVAVWGGDGSLSRALQELWRLKALEKTSLVLIPVGTANDFSKVVGLGPWKKTASQIFSGDAHVENFDLGQMKVGLVSKIFINNAGFGRTREALLRKSPQPLKDIMDFRENRLQLEWSTDHVQQFETFRAFFGTVFNGPFFSNGLYFNKDIKPNDGILNGFIVPPMSRSKLVRKFLKARLWGSLDDDRVFRMEGDSIVIDSNRDLFPQADGEPVSLDGVRQLRFSVLPGALKLWVPRKEGIDQEEQEFKILDFIF